MYIVSVLKIFPVLVSVWLLLISIISVSVWVSVTEISLNLSDCFCWQLFQRNLLTKLLTATVTMRRCNLQWLRRDGQTGRVNIIVCVCVWESHSVTSHVTASRLNIIEALTDTPAPVTASKWGFVGQANCVHSTTHDVTTHAVALIRLDCVRLRQTLRPQWMTLLQWNVSNQRCHVDSTTEMFRRIAIFKRYSLVDACVGLNWLAAGFWSRKLRESLVTAPTFLVALQLTHFAFTYYI